MIQELQNMGCDMDKAVERCMGDRDFYQRCFCRLVEKQDIEKLGELLAANDIKESFIMAHALQGTLSNLGLTPLMEILVTIVASLRRDSLDGVRENYDRLLKRWQVFKELV